VKRYVLLVLTVIPLLLLSACKNEGDGGSSAPNDLSVKDYYPANENTHYVYQGRGNEYASFDVYVDYASDGKVQQRVNNGGTVMANVVEISDDRLSKVFSREESYYRENFLDKSSGAGEILLMEPLEEGNSWNLEDGRTRTITGTAVDVSTPSGSYKAIEVTTMGKTDKTLDYYAKDIGLVKSVFLSDGIEISSSLSSIEKDVPFVQSIRFYYPSIDDDSIYFREKNIAFRTNDVTRKALEASYKKDVPERLGSVFSKNTAINSLYLNSDGMAYIDLSKEFLTEMNAGAGYESMLLQCVADTFGGYYCCERLILTIDGQLYESGHIALKKGEYLDVDVDSAIETE